MSSRHLDLLRELSAKKREKEEQQRREEQRLKKRETLLKERLLGKGSASNRNVSAPPPDTGARADDDGSAGATAEGPPGDDASVEQLREYKAQCNLSIERRQQEAIQKVLHAKRVAELKHEREVRKREWRAHRAQSYLLDRCTKPELKEFLEQRSKKPKALPKLPAISAMSRTASGAVSCCEGSEDAEADPQTDAEDVTAMDRTMSCGGATSSTCRPGSSGGDGSASASSLGVSSPEKDKDKERDTKLLAQAKGVSNFLGRLRLTRMRASCTTLAEWKQRNGCAKDQKVFICAGGYPDFREALLRRGWFENEDRDSRHFDLKWGMTSHIDHSVLKEEQVVNHFDSTRCLTTKVGLTCALRQAAWYSGVEADEFYPRAFDLYDPLERAEFVTNFKFSKAESILRGLIRDVDAGTAVTFGTDVISVALKVCNRLATDADEVIDCKEMAEELGSVAAADWEILKQVNLDDCMTPLECKLKDEELEMLVNKKSTRQASSKKAEPEEAQKKDEKKKKKKKKKVVEEDPIQWYLPTTSYASGRGAFLLKQSTSILEQLSAKSRQHDINGGRNAWIVKPSGKSRGRGIQVMRELDEIFKTTESDGFQWICQKYIERPMLVNGYKFDIRQWVLVADWNPLTVYIWRHPYLRFAGQKYDESISDCSAYKHLTNNSIIHDMDGFQNKSDDLDCHGYMWFLQQWQEYLHNTYCTHKKHHTPWLEPPPYTCDYYGVRWEDVMFVAREEDDEDDEDGIDDAPQRPPLLPQRSAGVEASPSSTVRGAAAEASEGSTTAPCSEDGGGSDGHGGGASAGASPSSSAHEGSAGGSSSSSSRRPSKCPVGEDGEGGGAEDVQDGDRGAGDGSGDEQAAADDGEERTPCEDLWKDCILPQFEAMIINSLLCVKDEVAHRKGSYELFGYDFMVGMGASDGRPQAWLIEVNSSPACDYSTPVTCPLVKKMMEDTAKVMADLREDPEAGTGEWELLRHAHTKVTPTRVGVAPQLVVQGKEILPPKGFKKKKKKKKKKASKASAAAAAAAAAAADADTDADEGDDEDSDGDDGDDDDDT